MTEVMKWSYEMQALKWQIWTYKPGRKVLKRVLKQKVRIEVSYFQYKAKATKPKFRNTSVETIHQNPTLWTVSYETKVPTFKCWSDISETTVQKQCLWNTSSETKVLKQEFINTHYKTKVMKQHLRNKCPKRELLN